MSLKWRLISGENSGGKKIKLRRQIETIASENKSDEDDELGRRWRFGRRWRDENYLIIKYFWSKTDSFDWKKINIIW